MNSIIGSIMNTRSLSIFYRSATTTTTSLLTANRLIQKQQTTLDLPTVTLYKSKHTAAQKDKVLVDKLLHNIAILPDSEVLKLCLVPYKYCRLEHNAAFAAVGENFLKVETFNYVLNSFDDLSALAVDDLTKHLCRVDRLVNIGEEHFFLKEKFAQLHMSKEEQEQALVSALYAILGATYKTKGKKAASQLVLDRVLPHIPPRDVIESTLKMLRPCRILNHIHSTSADLPTLVARITEKTLSPQRKVVKYHVVIEGQDGEGPSSEANASNIIEAVHLAASTYLDEHHPTLLEKVPIPDELEFMNEHEAIPIIDETVKQEECGTVKMEKGAFGTFAEFELFLNQDEYDVSVDTDTLVQKSINANPKLQKLS